MKSAQGLLFAFVIFGLIGSINFGFPFFDKEEFSAHVNVRNDGDDDLRRLYGFFEETDDVGHPDFDPSDIEDVKHDDLEDVSVRMFIPERGLMFTSSPFDIDGRNMRGKVLHGDGFDEDLCGEWVRISVSNDDVRRTKYRPILC